MVKIAELWRVPGKSMRAEQQISALYIDKRGLFGDREHMWVEAGARVNVNDKPGTEAGPGRFLSQREDPDLTGIVAGLVTDGLSFSRAGQDWSLVPRQEDVAVKRLPVSVWGWQGEGVDQGKRGGPVG